MREFTLEQLKPTRQLLNKINKELLTQREQKVKKYRESGDISAELAGRICLHNWDKLIKQGKVAALGQRQWFMEWDD